MRVSKKKIAAIALYFGIFLLIVVLNLLPWKSRTFSDWYIANIFPLWVSTYGRLTGLFAFSVGEWLVVAGIILVIVAVLLLPVAAVALVFRILDRKKEASLRRMSRLRFRIGRYYLFFAWVLLIVCLIMTLNCFILYHGTTFAQTYFVEDANVYDTDHLVALWNRIATQMNELSLQVERDENGRIVYPGSVRSDGSSCDMNDKAIECMQKLGEVYPQLQGFYPRPKPMFFSDLMCQEYIEGYYFPFSMEANYNDVMYIMNKPGSMCHELAHLRGYIQENEASFVSYMACVESDDIYFQYSGYLGVLYYVLKELNYAANHEPDFEEKYELVKLSAQIAEDNTFVMQEDWDRIEKEALFSTETMNAFSDAFIDTTLKVNGVSDGKHSYGRVVRLLLIYYGDR